MQSNLSIIGTSFNPKEPKGYPNNTNSKLLLPWRLTGIPETPLGTPRIPKGTPQEHIYTCISCYDFIEIIAKKGSLMAKRLVMLVETYNEIYHTGNKQTKSSHNGSKDEA